MSLNSSNGLPLAAYNSGLSRLFQGHRLSFIVLLVTSSFGPVQEPTHSTYSSSGRLDAVVALSVSHAWRLLEPTFRQLAHDTLL